MIAQFVECSKNFSSLGCSTCSTLLQFLSSSRFSLFASIRFIFVCGFCLECLELILID